MAGWITGGVPGRRLHPIAPPVINASAGGALPYGRLDHGRRGGRQWPSPDARKILQDMTVLGIMALNGLLRFAENASDSNRLYRQRIACL